MQNRAFAPVLLVISIAVSVLVLGVCISYFTLSAHHNDTLQNAKVQSSPPVVQPRPSSSENVRSAAEDNESPTKPAQQVGASAPKDWKTLTLAKYSLQISYPGNSDWSRLDNCSVSGGSLLVPMLCLTNVVSVRTLGRDCCQYEVIAVSVADKHSSSSLTTWLKTVGVNLDEVPAGNLDDALTRAYSEQTEQISRVSSSDYLPPADHLIVHNERENNGSTVAEVGTITGGGGRLTYSSFIAPLGSDHVYAVELSLEFDPGATNVGDREVIDVYKRVVSSVAFTK